jgi:hypothetical protein
MAESGIIEVLDGMPDLREMESILARFESGSKRFSEW